MNFIDNNELYFKEGGDAYLRHLEFKNNFFFSIFALHMSF